MKPTPSTLAQAHPDHPKLADLGVTEGAFISNLHFRAGIGPPSWPLQIINAAKEGAFPPRSYSSEEYR